MTEKEIFELLKKLLVEYFEIDENKITMEAKLYEDLTIDSIDAIDMMSYLKKETGKELDPAQFKAVRTIADIVKVVKEELERNENN